MNELLCVLDELGAELEGSRSPGQALRYLQEVWPDELESLCEHVWLLRLLVIVCEATHSEEVGW